MEEDELKKVGIRELRADLSRLLSGGVPLEVVKHGHTVGYYFPIQHESKLAEITALKSIAEQCQTLLKQMKLEEDTLVEEFKSLKR